MALAIGLPVVNELKKINKKIDKINILTQISKLLLYLFICLGTPNRIEIL